MAEMSSRDRAGTGHGSLATCPQVNNRTAGLCNNYTFLSGLQAQEIWLGSPDRSPCERCGLGTRLSIRSESDYNSNDHEHIIALLQVLIADTLIEAHQQQDH